MKYFFDNNISFRLVRMLAALEVQASSLRDSFPEQIADVDFLRALCDNHDVYVTYVHKQRTRDAEARAIKEAQVTALWLGRFWARKTFWEHAVWLVKNWQKIDGFVKGVQPGTCAVIKENGRAEVFRL